MEFKYKEAKNKLLLFQRFVPTARNLIINNNKNKCTIVQIYLNKQSVEDAINSFQNQINIVSIKLNLSRVIMSIVSVLTSRCVPNVWNLSKSNKKITNKMILTF